MLKILKSKKGITLVELIVGMVVLAIILATVSAILFPMMRFQSRANELAEQNALLDDIANQIIYDLSMAIRPLQLVPATGITLTAGTGTLIIPIPASEGGDVTYTISAAGVINRNQAGRTNPLLPGEFHMRMYGTGLRVIEITITPDTTTGIAYELTLRLGRTGNEPLEFQRTYAVRPLALN